MSSDLGNIGLLASGLMARWCTTGHTFDTTQVNKIATLLHANGVCNVLEIDYINLSAQKAMMYGFDPADAQMLACAQIQGGNHWCTLAQTRDGQLARNDATRHQKVGTGIAEFDLEKWCSVQAKLDNLFLDDIKYIVGRQLLRTPQEARRTDSNKSCRVNKFERRMGALHRKVIQGKVNESPSIDAKSISMVELDSKEIEQAIDRCWTFFITYGQKSVRYKNMFKNGEPDPEQIHRQRDCSRTDQRLIKPFPNGCEMLNCVFSISFL